MSDRSSSDGGQGAGGSDLFLEPDPQVRVRSLESLIRQKASEAPPLPSDLTEASPARSAISPAFAFGLGVAGLVTAAVAYYQLSQYLADRGQATDAVSTTRGTGAGASRGQVDVTSDPSGATVSINGKPRGVTPLTLTNEPAGRLEVTISRGSARVTRTIELTAGGTATVAAALPTAPARPSAPAVRPSAAAPIGWITIDSPVDLRIAEGGQTRGNSRDGRLALAPGTYELEFSSEEFEIRQSMTVSVVEGRTTPWKVALPNGLLSVNALPWADVWIDGAPVGTTPLANLTLAVGPHEIVWRHPTLGERRQTVAVKTRTPARVGVDFNR